MGAKARGETEKLTAKTLDLSKVGTKLTETFAGLHKGSLALAETIGKLRYAIGAAGLSLTGFITAGFAGTTHSGALSDAFRRLSMGIAQMFVPQMEKVIDLVRRAGLWFQNLTGEQQRNIVRWIEAVVVGGAVVLIFPKIFAGLMLVSKGLIAVTLLTLGFNVATGGILPLIGFLITGAVGLGVAMKVANEGIGGLVGGMDGLKSAGQKLLEVLEKLMDRLEDLAQVWKNTKHMFTDGLTGKSYPGIDPKDFRMLRDDEAKTARMLEQGKQGKAIRDEAIRKGLIKPDQVISRAEFEELAKKLGKEDPFKSKKSDASRLTQQVGGPEAMTATIERIQQAALNADINRQIQDNTKAVAENTKEMLVIMQQGMDLKGTVNTGKAGFDAFDKASW